MTKQITTLTKILTGLAGLLMASVSFAATNTSIMVTVNHVVPAKDVQKYVRALERTDVSMGTCYFSVKLVDYIEDEQNASATYYGTAILEVQENCAQDKTAAYFKGLSELQAKGVYTLFGNPPIEAHPGMSGRN